MALLIQLALLALVVWLALSVAWLIRTRRRAGPSARWEARTHALPEGGHVVEIACAGEPVQVVRSLPGDLDWETLGDELAAAMAEAEGRAATLNAMRPR